MHFDEIPTAIITKSFARECRRALIARGVKGQAPTDKKLLEQISGAEADVGRYFSGGFTTSLAIRAALKLCGKSIRDFRRVLDFGCGSARVLRWFHDVLPHTELHGCDVNKDAVDWCTENIRYGRFALISERPPLPYSPASFDFIYGISVMTHLDEELHLAWLNELDRVLKPDGVLILTVHGDFAANLTLPQEDYDAFRGSGFVYHKPQDRRTLEGLPDFYQVAFHSRDYVQDRWGHLFELIGYIRHGSMWTQEAMVLRKKQKPSVSPMIFDLPLCALDDPPLGLSTREELWIRGWAFYPNGRKCDLDIWIDSTRVGRVTCGNLRDDVANALHSTPALNSGFELVVPLSGFGEGPHVIWLAAPYEPFPMSASYFYRAEGVTRDIGRYVERSFADWSYRLRCAIRFRSRLRSRHRIAPNKPLDEN